MVTILNLKAGFYEEQWVESYVDDEGLTHETKNSSRHYFKNHFDKMYLMKLFRDNFSHDMKYPCGNRYELITN